MSHNQQCEGACSCHFCWCNWGCLLWLWRQAMYCIHQTAEISDSKEGIEVSNQDSFFSRPSWPGSLDFDFCDFFFLDSKFKGAFLQSLQNQSIEICLSSSNETLIQQENCPRALGWSNSCLHMVQFFEGGLGGSHLLLKSSWAFVLMIWFVH